MDYGLYVWHTPAILRAVPIFPLELVEPRKDIAKTGARNPCFSLHRIPRAGFRDVFPRLDELKRKNRDCSKSTPPQDLIRIVPKSNSCC